MNDQRNDRETRCDECGETLEIVKTRHCEYGDCMVELFDPSERFCQHHEWCC